MRRPGREPGATWVLFAASGALAVVVGVANAAALIHTTEVARLRDLRLLARARLFLDAHAPTLLGGLPTLLHVPFNLGDARSALTFGALAIAVHLVMAWGLAIVAAPLVVPRARATGSAPWPHGYPLAVIAAWSIPVVAHRLSLWTTAPTLALWAASVVLMGGAWWLATRLVRTDAAAARIVRIAGGVALGGIAIAGVGTVVVAARAVRSGEAPPVPAAGTPNVLLISIDTLRPDHLGSYGYARNTSPTLDALAAAGARFTTVVSPTSWTLPAHMTLLTALPPEVHGVENDGLRLDTSVVTLAEVLQTHGYATAGFVSGPYLDAGYGFARGFDHYDDYSAVRLSRPAVHQAHTSPALLSALTSWLDAWEGKASRRPFFVFVHMWDVHYDFNPPPPYDRLFDPDYDGAVTGLDFELGDAVHAGMPARDLAHVVALYDGEIRYTDAYVGRMLDALRAHRLLDDTVVVVTADHGEEFFEHGKKGHRNALYDESIRVPLIARYPRRIPAGTVVDRQVRLVDVAATILALTDTPAPPTFGLAPALTPYAGQSLLALIAGGAAAPALPAFADLQPHALSAIRHEDRKLILAPFADPREQLFDLRSDPTELKNEAMQNPALTSALAGELATWHDTARLAAKHSATATMTEDHKAALRALGYVK